MARTKKQLKKLEDPYKLYYNFSHIPAHDYGTLVANFILGLQDQEIGYEHANAPKRRFMRRTHRIVSIRRADVESLLWSANLLDEKGKFWHPEGKTFNEFVKDLGQGEFDRDLNYFKDGKKRNGDDFSE